MEYDWKGIVADLNQYLKLKTIPIGLQRFATKAEAEKVDKIRWPKHLHMPCQILAQAMQLGFTIGVSTEYVAGDNCSYTVGLLPQTEEWRNGDVFNGAWCGNACAASDHHHALTRIEKSYEAIVAAPLASGRLQPDACMFTCTPSQAFFLLSGYLRNDCKPIQTTFVGESGCSMTWVKTMNTGEIGLSVPCFAEVRYAGISEQDVVVSLTPDQLVTAVQGLKELSKVGLRYPIASYSTQMDVCEGAGVTYDESKLHMAKK